MAYKFRVCAYDGKESVGEVYAASKVDELIAGCVGVDDKVSFCASDSVGGQTATGSYQTLNLDNIILPNKHFSLSDNEITINKTGRFCINYTIVFREVSSGKDFGTVVSKVDLYTTDYDEVIQSHAKTYVREDTDGCSVERGFLADITFGDKIRVQFKVDAEMSDVETEQYYSGVSIHEI